MRKSINRTCQVLKAFAISSVLLTVSNYFYITDFTLQLIIFFVLSAMLARTFLKKKIEAKSVKELGIYLGILFLSISCNVYSNSYYSDKSLNDDFYMLMQSETNKAITKSDTLIFNFSDTKGYRNINCLKILEKNNINARDVIYIDYQFRPIDRICIGGISYNKETDFLDYFGFGNKRIEINGDRIRLIDNGKEFFFKKLDNNSA